MNDKARYTSDQRFGWPIQALFWLEWATRFPQAPDVIRRACDFRSFRVFCVANRMLFTPHKAVILSEAPRRSIA